MATSPFLANTFNPGQQEEHNGNELDVLKFLSPRDFKDQERVCMALTSAMAFPQSPKVERDHGEGSARLYSVAR